MVPAKGFTQSRLLGERLTLLLLPPWLESTWSRRTLKTNTKQSTEHAVLQKGNPGACLGLASDPSVGPRVNRNRQMKRKRHKGKLFFQGGKRLPFRDLQ